MSAPLSLSLPEFRGILTATPSESEIVQLADDLSGFATQLDGHFKLIQTTATAAPYLGMMGLVLGIASGGLPGAIVLGIVSFAGGLSGGFFGSSFQEKLDSRVRTVYTLSQILKRSKPHRLRGLWQLSGSTEEFVRFLLAIASNWTEEESKAWGSDWWIRCPVGETEEWLEPTIGFCHQFARSRGISPEELLDQLNALDAPPSVPQPSPNLFPAFPQQDAPISSPAVTVPVTALPIQSPATPIPQVVPITPAQGKDVGFSDTLPLSQPEPIVIPQPPTAYSILVDNPFSSRAGFGWQRTGKSYLFAIATQELALERGVQIFHINLASYGDEDSRYWGHAVQSVRCDLPSLDEYQAQHFIDRAIECVHQFFATRNAVLVLDEITLTGSLNNQHAEAVAPLLKLVADKISCLASTGVKRAQAIWTLSPDFVAGNCTQDCKAIKSLSLCYVTIPPGKSVDWNGNPVKFHQETFENVKRNFPSLTYPEGKWKGDRICFVDGKWRELGELPALREATPQAQNATSNSEQIARKLEAIYERSESLPFSPISDWDNGYQVTDDALLEVLEFIRGKCGTDPINPSEVHRSQTSIRKLYDGKVDNLKALLFRAVREELAILDSDDKGSPVIRLL